MKSSSDWGFVTLHPRLKFGLSSVVLLGPKVMMALVAARGVGTD